MAKERSFCKFMNERKIYLDNLRILTVLLVMIYHVFYLFNGVGVLGGFSVEKSIGLFDSFCTLVYPWFMILIFCIAGVSAKYSVSHRGAKKFIKERATKLIVPSTLGIIAVYWVVGYINIKIGGGLEYIPDFLVYPISVLSGIGPLWFAQLLFLFSFVTPFLNKINEKFAISEKCKIGKTILLIALGAFLIWGSAQILNMPLITVYRFGIYFVAYAIGFLVFSNDEAIEALKRALPVTLPLALLFGTAYMILFNGKDYSSDAVLKNIVTNFYAWFTMIAILEMGNRYLNERYVFSEAMTKNTYSYYVLHYPILLSSAYVIYTYTDISTIWIIAILIVTIPLLTIAFANVIKRIPVLRFIMLGIRGKHEIQTDN